MPQVCELTVFSWTQTSVDITLSRGSSGFHILWTTWSAGTIQMDGLLTPIYNLQSLFSTKQPPPPWFIIIAAPRPQAMLIHQMLSGPSMSPLQSIRLWATSSVSVPPSTTKTQSYNYLLSYQHHQHSGRRGFTPCWRVLRLMSFLLRPLNTITVFRFLEILLPTHRRGFLYNLYSI